ncbi:zona pellucida sperm-binding protein 3-like isoform X2 [Xiphias gladius]|uniref:zona pellucida sperm-binding protein 3-like isoform X2 n=1 Tax=Xiphias gladius TaxID=8245 RepID=UPI001A995AF0|nr:zona pellucida sperm-binding protein 3-like isoform X2 [Xiphias gladius]
MDTMLFGVNLLVGLFLSGLCVQSSLVYPQTHYTQHALLQRPQLTQSQSPEHTVHEQQKAPAEEREHVNTIRVTCHPDLLEIVIKADMFGVGAPVNSDDLRLGVEHNDFCRATASSRDEYRIVVGLTDCGTKHWMTEDSLVYTNLIIYSPVASPAGLIRMDEAVVPIECHYQRKFSLSSSPLQPTWIPFMSTQAAVEILEFDLRLMTNDWLYERSSNVFYLGEPISIEASIRVGHHMGLRVFVSSCVATLNPDIYSLPRYVFVENGCLVDSQLPGSKSHFLSRLQDDKLHLVIDAFRFHDEDRGELYITCHLNAVPVNDAEAPNKACTSVNGRWRSADGNDYLCGYCESQNEAGQTHNKPSSPGKFGPRGFGKPTEPEALWRSGMKTNKGLEKGLLPGPPSTPDLVEYKDDKSGTDLQNGDAENKVAAPLETVAPEVAFNLMPAALDNTTAATSDVSPTDPLKPDVPSLSNATAIESDLSDTNDPKR